MDHRLTSTSTSTSTLSARSLLDPDPPVSTPSAADADTDIDTHTYAARTRNIDDPQLVPLTAKHPTHAAQSHDLADSASDSSVSHTADSGPPEHHSASTMSTESDSGTDPADRTPRSSATAYSLDATHLRERVTSVGRLPRGSASSRRLAALFGDLPSSSRSSPYSASTAASTPSHASREPPPAQPRPRSPSPSRTTSPQPTPTSASTTTPTGTTTLPPTYPSTEQPTPVSGLFECNICLDTASHPVVTLCGHLFCWPCLDPWFKSCTARHSAVTCPVCKSGCGPDKTIPIFARGREAIDPRTSVSSSGAASSNGAAGANDAASPRPEAQRSEPVPPPRTWRNVWGLGAGAGGGFGGGAGARANVQFGVFPGLFGMTINLGDGGAGAPEAMRGDPQENQNIASALTLMGVMILMNLFFGLFLF